MGNICYTQYRVEGPTKEIDALAQKINRDLKRAYYDGSCRWLVYGRTMKEIIPADIEPMNNGWSVLSFEAPSKWTPCYQEWEAYIRKVVRKAVVYYYGEEFGCGVCETNDVWYKYFKFDFVTVLRKSEQTRKDIVMAFAADAEYREREDQYKEYITYWGKTFFRRTLRCFVPYHRRRHLLDLIERMDMLMLKEDWWNTMQTHLGIYIVKRLEEKKEHPCRHCVENRELQEENNSLHIRVERLEHLIWKRFRSRHSKK